MRPILLAPVALACSLVSFPIAAQATPTQQDQGSGVPDRIALSADRELRVVNVRSLVTKYRRPWQAPVIGPSIVTMEDPDDRLFAPGLPASPTTREQLGTLLDAVFGDVSGSSTVHRSLARKSAFLVDSKESVARVASFLQNLANTVAPRVSVQLVVFKSDNVKSEPGSMSVDAALALATQVRGAGKILFEGTSEGRAGDELEIGEHHRSSFVADQNVEVADNSEVYDPEIDVVDTGPSLWVQVLPCPSRTSMALFGLLSIKTSVGEMARFELGGPRGGYVDVPKVRVVQRVISARFDGDGALLLAPGGADDTGLHALVICRRLDRAVDSDDYAIVPTGVLASTALRRFHVPLILPTGESFPSDEGDSPNGVDLGLGDDDPNNLIDLLWKFSELDTDATSTEKRPGFLVIHGGRGGIAGSRRFADILGQRLSQAFVVELTAEQRPADSANAEWKRRGEPLRIHCLSDRVGVAVDTLTQRYVRDYNVEVAANTGASDPVVGDVFAGTHAVAGVDPRPNTTEVTICLLDAELVSIRTAGTTKVDTRWHVRLLKR